MTGGNFRHYYLMPDGEIEMVAGQEKNDCIPYIIQQGDKYTLCVIEGDAFHSFDINVLGMARLAEESTSALRKRLMARP